MKVPTVLRNADDLVTLLVDEGPMTATSVCERLDWPRSRFIAALRTARDTLCKELDVAIPAPTPEDGWLYQVTTEWQPVEAGASYALGLTESRLRAIQRDVEIILPKLSSRSKEGRRANFLSKHLAHILGTLTEINDG